MNDLIQIPTDAEPHLTDQQADVHIGSVFTHPRYGRKLAIDAIPPWEDDGECLETLKDLSWEATHRAWDDVRDTWSADLESLNLVVSHMTQAGYQVTVSVDVARTFEDTGRVFMPDYREGPTDTDTDDPSGAADADPNPTDGGFEIPDGYQLTKARRGQLEFTRMADLKHVGVEPKDHQWVVTSDIPGDDDQVYPMKHHSARGSALVWAADFMAEHA